jgi:uncharacterized RDD family membrane protein YckC
MSGAAQRVDMPEETQLLATGTDGAFVGTMARGESPAELKQAVAERLAAHRQRRAAEQAGQIEAEKLAMERAEAARKASRRGSANVRAAVAARYQESQSYREFLAAEAERALQQAQAEAEVAARNAAAVAEAQQQLLAEIAEWEKPAPQPQLVRDDVRAEAKAEARDELAHALADLVMGAQELIAEPPYLTVMDAGPVVAAEPLGGLTVRLYDEVVPVAPALSARKSRMAEPVVADEELSQLEQEIEFRRTPEFPAPHVVEVQPIAANIIEFPRQLIAPRKARPRIAEGPLREEADPEPQLRIFEVEPEQVSVEPVQVQEAQGAPEWQSLLLESTLPLRQPQSFESQSNLTFQPQTAPVSLRLKAAAMDAFCVLCGVAAFVSVVVKLAGPTLKQVKPAMLAGSVVGALIVFALAYLTMFFTFSEQTPGMKFARIALCTFGDDYPTRQAMRRRTFALLLAACPLGLGFAWIWMDNDRLGWHDRISRMYQRAY